MRILSILALIIGGAPLLAADKPEETAKEAALALLKAVKTKDADKVMALADVPFLYKDNGLMAHKDAAALKKWLTEKLQEIKDPDKTPTAVDEMISFESLKPKIKEADRALVEEAMGKEGFVALVKSEDGKKVGIAIRMKDGKAKIVGIIN